MGNDFHRRATKRTRTLHFPPNSLLGQCYCLHSSDPPPALPNTTHPVLGLALDMFPSTPSVFPLVLETLCLEFLRDPSEILHV